MTEIEDSNFRTGQLGPPLMGNPSQSQADGDSSTSDTDSQGSNQDSFPDPQRTGAEPLRRVELALGIVRLGVGAALVIAPRWAGRIWVGPGADGPGSLVFARALGARDVALGLRIVMAVRSGQPAGQWVIAGFAADGADAIATLVAAPHLTRSRRVLSPSVAAAVGLTGVWSFRRARDAS